MFIISKAADLDDLEPVGKRLLQNPKDFAKLLTPIYGIKVAGRFEELFTQHLTIAADLLDAAKKGEVSKADAIRNRWYKNADEIAGFLASVNPCWDKARWKDMCCTVIWKRRRKKLFCASRGITQLKSTCLIASKTRHIKWRIICSAA